MCVIIAGRHHKASTADLYRCATANGDGMGVGWVTKDGKVRFERDITVPDMKKLIDAAPGDWVAHFRIATVGKTRELVHPFVVSEESPLTKSGEAEQLLFHNGHWTDWEGICADLRDEFKLTVPPGPWSDSRAAAWLTAHVGPVALESLTGKFALLGRGGYLLFPLNHAGWVGHQGMWFSNESWKYRTSAKSSWAKYMNRSGSGETLPPTTYDTIPPSYQYRADEHGHNGNNNTNPAWDWERTDRGTYLPRLKG